MEIDIKTIDHKSQFYATLGDWHFDKLGKLKLYVSELGNDDFNFLIAVHELIEAYLCKKRGIKQEDVTAFDIDMISKGIDDPGSDPRAPYHREHQFASNIEMLVLHELGIKEHEYDEAMLGVYIGNR